MAETYDPRDKEKGQQGTSKKVALRALVSNKSR